LNFLWARGLKAKDIHKETFPVYSGKRLSCKAVHNWVKKFSQGHPKATSDAQPNAELVERAVKRLLCCGFQRAGKAMGTSASVLVEDMVRNKRFPQV
jgi:hypothetical protein